MSRDRTFEPLNLVVVVVVVAQSATGVFCVAARVDTQFGEREFALETRSLVSGTFVASSAVVCWVCALPPQ